MMLDGILDNLEGLFALGCGSEIFMAVICHQNIVFDADATNREIALDDGHVDVLGVDRIRKVKSTERERGEVTNNLSASHVV